MGSVSHTSGKMTLVNLNPVH